MEIKDTLNMTFQAGPVGNNHTVQAFCDVINEQDGVCRCPLMIILSGTKQKIGEIIHVSRREDLGQGVLTLQAKLSNNFVMNFDVKPGSAPELQFRSTLSGLITHVVLLNWSENFASRKTKKS